MTKDDILRIERPEDLYPGDLEEAKHRYRTLSRRWHPDRADGDTEVFQRIHEMYTAAVARLQAGRWEGSGLVHVRAKDGTDRVLKVHAGAPFTLGHSLITEGAVWYLVEPEHRDYVDHAHRMLRSCRFASEAMRAEVARYLPNGERRVALEDGRVAVLVPKTPDLIRLRDVVTHFGLLDARHVAWIVSSLMNLACYLSYTKLVHHDISLDTYFISPEHHSGALLGGWWHAQPAQTAVDVVPRRTLDAMPFAARMNKIADPLTDLELVRLTARECLAPGAPAPMVSWLLTPGTGPAVAQYAEWMRVLHAAFGPRRFTVLPVTARDVYGTVEPSKRT